MGLKLNLKGAKDKLSAQPEALSPHRIMVVDDEAANLESLEYTLGKAYPVSAYTDAREALGAIDQGEDISVIISDYRMPNMSGVDFFKALQSRGHPAIRVMLTGFAALDNVIAAINDCNVYKYVTKPINGPDLLEVVKDAVVMRNIYDENRRLITIVKELLELNSELAKDNENLGGDLYKHGRIQAGEPRSVQLSVLFADVRGFTKAMEASEPKAVLAVLQSLFATMHEIVYAHGGIVDKHLGDGLMAVFGLSGEGSGTGSSMRALRQLVDATASVLEGLPAPFNQLKVSFGLAAGKVVVGMLGSDRRSELAVLGRPANFAARLQEFTKSALRAESLSQPLGQFERVMALVGLDGFDGALEGVEIVNLPDNLRVRDFAGVSRVGVLRG